MAQGSPAEQQFQRRAQVRRAVLTMANAITPDGQSVAAEDDVRWTNAHLALVETLHDEQTALGVSEALRELWQRWYLERTLR
ncbi:MAG TPA: hypothetical protein VKB76_14730 [Ktedonobacterales bacterium]|nr:hypothetical protein [Ktedonobacterales bacterium]